MEQHFFDAVKPAWESAGEAPQPRPPWLLASEDSGRGLCPPTRYWESRQATSALRTNFPHLLGG